MRLEDLGEETSQNLRDDIERGSRSGGIEPPGGSASNCEEPEQQDSNLI